jgi:hypothetical protein
MDTTGTTNATLGKALAFIRNIHEMDVEKLEGLSIVQKNYITQLHHRFVELSMPETKKSILENIPQHACLSDKPFLNDNKDFFISFLLLGPDDDNEEIHKDLLKHLNDCHWCFEIFTQVLRDYFHSSRNLTN